MSSYLIDISNNIPLISNFNKFIKLHPNFYQLNINHRIIIAENKEVCTIYEEPLHFNDAIHNILGYITTDYEITNAPNGTPIHNYTFKICINKSENNTEQYHMLIDKYIKLEAKHGDRIQLNYYKILNEQLITHRFYDAKLSDWVNDVERLKNEFFSPHKKYLFDVMSTKNRHGNWSNLILYGEPGTGKSSFVFRLATQLKMSIISVDLSMYIDRKRDLYSIFHGNEFSLPYGKGDKLSISQNCIIILEEFDSAIEKIKHLENIFLFKNDTINSYISNKTTELSKKVQNTTQVDIPLSDPYQLISSRQNNSTEVDPLKITNEIFDIVKTITEDNKSDILRLRDLLELFQGPVPICDRIIVATTNIFEEIKEVLPALFRPGRLTPIKFTYLDWTSFEELCQYYFKTIPTVPQFEIKIPTSQITELAIKYTSLNTCLDTFLEELIELNNLSTLKKEQPIENPSKDNNVVETNNYIQNQLQEFNYEEVNEQTTDEVEYNNKIKMYSKWIDQKLGNFEYEETKNNVLTDNEDDNIRNMVVDKVLNKDKQIMKKYKDYDVGHLLQEYQQAAILTPQYDEMY
jgi:SpoVK/Ycf46/Vps4 family AAA+-type ATPase